MTKKTFEDDMLATLKDKLSSSNTTASYLCDSTTNVKNWISTGSEILDVVLSNKENGGFPIGRLTEIAGGEGAGKSLMASYSLADTQRKGGVAILIDTEHAASMEVLEGVGVDTAKLIYLNAGSIEEVFEAMEAIVSTIIKTKKDKDIPITIVWDSVAATSTKAEIEGTYDQHTIALGARLISKGLRKYIPICAANNVCLIFINQLRTNIGVTFGDKYTTPGGKAIPYHATVRLRLTHFKKIVDPKTKNTVGRIIKCEVTKNKVAPPMRTVFYTIKWGSKPGAWIDTPSSLWEAGVTSGVFEQKTKMTCKFKYPSTGEYVEFTKKKFEDLLDEPDFYGEVKKAITKHYIITKDSITNVNDLVHEDSDETEGT